MKAQADSTAEAQPSSNADQTFGGTLTAVTPAEPPAQALTEEVELRQVWPAANLGCAILPSFAVALSVCNWPA